MPSSTSTRLVNQKKRPREAAEGTLHDSPCTRESDNPSKRPQIHSSTAKLKERQAQCVQVGLLHGSPKPSVQLWEASPIDSAAILKEARVSWWSENGTWPTPDDEVMDRFLALVEDAHAKTLSPCRKRSIASLASGSSASSSMPRNRPCAAYRHPVFQQRLQDCRSFLNDHELGITSESEKLCQQLLNGHQPLPVDTVFSDDNLFQKTCRRLEGENEAKVTMRISELIVPSAELLADQGAQHLLIVRESYNARWKLSVPFMNPSVAVPGSFARLRPQPDSTKGFDRSAFNQEQLQKMQPYLGDLVTDSSFFAATFQMYFPFLTCEVKCGDGELDVADRQNAYSQSVLLTGLYKAFRLVGREQELQREINGFSVSHDEKQARIYGHYLFITENEAQIHRHLITRFFFAPSGDEDHRWKAYTFVKNVYDLWLPKHYERLCTVIDMLPENTFGEQELSSLRSGQQ